MPENDKNGKEERINNHFFGGETTEMVIASQKDFYEGTILKFWISFYYNCSLYLVWGSQFVVVEPHRGPGLCLGGVFLLDFAKHFSVVLWYRAKMCWSAHALDTFFRNVGAQTSLP